MSRQLRRGVVLALFVITAVSSLRIPLLPEIGADLRLSGGQIGIITAVFGLGRIITNIPAGRTSDRLSPAVASSIAAAFMAAGTLVVALAPDFAILLVGTAMVGSASAMMNTTAMTSLTRSAPPGRRGAAMATYSTSLMTGQVVGPAVAGLAAAVFSWRVTHEIGTAIALAVAFVLVAIWIGDRRRIARQASAEGPVPAGARAAVGKVANDSDMTTIQLLAVSSVSFAVFFALSALPQTVMPLIAADELGISVEVLGLAIAVSAVARVIGARIAGRVADSVSRRAALLPSLVLLGLSPLLLIAPWGWAGWLTVLLVLSFASSGAAIAGTVIGDLSRPERLGARMGVYRTIGDVGLLVGGLVCGIIYELGGVTPTALVVTGVTALASVLAFTSLPREGSGLRR